DDRPAQHFEQIDITEAKEDSQGQPENRVAEKGLGRTELVPVGIQDGGVIVRQRVGQQLVDTTSDEETFLGGVQFSTLQHVHPLVAVGNRYDQVSQYGETNQDEQDVDVCRESSRPLHSRWPTCRCVTRRLK